MFNQRCGNHTTKVNVNFKSLNLTGGKNQEALEKQTSWLVDSYMVGTGRFSLSSDSHVPSQSSDGRSSRLSGRKHKETTARRARITGWANYSMVYGSACLPAWGRVGFRTRFRESISITFTRCRIVPSSEVAQDSLFPNRTAVIVNHVSLSLSLSPSSSLLHLSYAGILTKGATTSLSENGKGVGRLEARRGHRHVSARYIITLHPAHTYIHTAIQPLPLLLTLHYIRTSARFPPIPTPFYT